MIGSAVAAEERRSSGWRHRMSEQPRASVSDATSGAPFVRGYTIALSALAVLFVANALSVVALREAGPQRRGQRSGTNR